MAGRAGLPRESIVCSHQLLSVPLLKVKCDRSALSRCCSWLAAATTDIPTITIHHFCPPALTSTTTAITTATTTTTISVFLYRFVFNIIFPYIYSRQQKYNRRLLTNGYYFRPSQLCICLSQILIPSYNHEFTTQLQTL